MKVVITPEANGELDEIWKWNARERGTHHADSYVDFLRKSISALGETYARGRPVSNYAEFRYLLIQRCAGGHGHIAIYEIIGDVVHILHVFHTAQDWQSRIVE